LGGDLGGDPGNGLAGESGAALAIGGLLRLMSLRAVSLRGHQQAIS
jgi:hypothetical protein